MLKTTLRASAMVIIVTFGLLTSPTFIKQPISSEAYFVNQAVSFDIPKSDPNIITTEIKAKKDDRAERLAKFLRSQNSPMARDAKSLVKTADKYDLDWKLLPAIAGVESTYGIFIPTGSYNPYGWNNGSFYFENWAVSSDYVAKQIKVRWGYMGTATPWKIGPSYAANPNWASRVSFNMFFIENY
jgi:hypothetical protein